VSAGAGAGAGGGWGLGDGGALQARHFNHTRGQLGGQPLDHKVRVVGVDGFGIADAARIDGVGVGGAAQVKRLVAGTETTGTDQDLAIEAAVSAVELPVHHLALGAGRTREEVKVEKRADGDGVGRGHVAFPDGVPIVGLGGHLDAGGVHFINGSEDGRHGRIRTGIGLLEAGQQLRESGQAGAWGMQQA